MASRVCRRPGHVLFIRVIWVILFSGPAIRAEPPQQEVAGRASGLHAPLELPSSPELFRAAAREANPRWRQFYRATSSLPHRKRNHSAFALGSLLCETLLAAEARDPQYVRNSIQDVRDCLTLLGLAEALDNRLPAIHEFAEKQNWPCLRFEIEALEGSFQLLLKNQMDAPLTTLIGLGHQLRCLDVCAAIASQDSHPVGIDDPVYYATLIERITRLPASTREIPFLRDLSEELERLRVRWSQVTPEEDVSEHVAATAEKIRNFLNRTMEAQR